MGYTVKIDKRSCQSSGNCVDALPEAFVWDDDELGEVRPGAGALPEARLLEAARRCPALAITLYRADGSEVDL